MKNCQSNKTTKILRKYKDMFEALANYDKTGKLKKLKKLKEKTGKPISQIIEERILKGK